MRIGIFTDLHANLPALQRAIETFKKDECDLIVHLGDLVGIGPYPQECMKLAISVPNMKFIMGNHDYWAGFGLPGRLPKGMSVEEQDHQRWVFQQIDPELRKSIQKWPFKKEMMLGNTKLGFMHYGLNEQENWFGPFIKEPNEENLSVIFDREDADVICYGHQHLPSDFQGKSRYVNIGSAGCHNIPEVRLAILEEIKGQLHISKKSIAYDDNGLMEAFEEREVPARNFITNTFITR